MCAQNAVIPILPAANRHSEESPFRCARCSYPCNTGRWRSDTLCDPVNYPMVLGREISLPWRICVRKNKVLMCMALAVGAVWACPPSRAQSVADAARAAKEKKKKQSDATQQGDKKPKVYTNDEIPESKTADSQPAPSKTADAKTPSLSDANATASSAQAGLPHGPDAAHVDFKFTSARLKRPGKAETLWMVKNTSDHFESVDIKPVITGPCGYHQEYPGGEAKLTSGQGITNNWQADLTVMATDCAGTYRLELRASVAGKLLDSASDSITVD